MLQEFTTQGHIGTDGILHLDALNIATDLQETPVTVKVTVEVEPEAKPKNLAEALKGRVGQLKGAPPDLSSRTGETYAECLAEDYRRRQQSNDAV